jgi:hypothetical protein
LNEFYYCVLEKPHSIIMRIQRTADGWSKREILSFSGYYSDCEPQISADGQCLYFCSDRPLDGQDGPKNYDIWYVERTEDGWEKPVNPGPPLNTEKNEFYPSLTKEGTIYFTSYDMKIYRSKFVDGNFTSPKILSDSINSGTAEYNAFIAPDESYLIFTSHGWEGGREGRGDLFISFKKGDETWSRAKNLGPKINSKAIDYCPSVSPDGKYLFFSSARSTE